MHPEGPEPNTHQQAKKEKANQDFWAPYEMPKVKEMQIPGFLNHAS